jgi:hypothetical protein
LPRNKSAKTLYNKEMQMNNWFFHRLCIILGLVFGAGVVLASPTPTPVTIPCFPSSNSTVSRFVEDDGKLFLGGTFTQIGGKTRTYLAKIDLQTGDVLDSFQPVIDGDVGGLFYDNGVLYIGGRFNTVNGQSRRGMAALDSNTGAVLPWYPGPLDATGTILDIEIDNGVFYACGGFNTVNGVSRKEVFAASTITAALLSGFNANINSWVWDIEVTGNRLFFSGPFTTVDGSAQQRLGAFDLATGSVASGIPKVNASLSLSDNWCDIYGMDYDSATDVLYLTGHFNDIGGQSRSSLAAISATTGLILPWAPTLDVTLGPCSPPCAGGYRIALHQGVVVVGGVFSRHRGKPE